MWGSMFLQGIRRRILEVHEPANVIWFLKNLSITWALFIALFLMKVHSCSQTRRGAYGCYHVSVSFRLHECYTWVFSSYFSGSQPVFPPCTLFIMPEGPSPSTSSNPPPPTKSPPSKVYYFVHFNIPTFWVVSFCGSSSSLVEIRSFLWHYHHCFFRIAVGCQKLPVARCVCTRLPLSALGVGRCS